MQSTEVHIERPIRSTTPSSWCNAYDPNAQPVIPKGQLYGPTPYDINFCFPYVPRALETDQIKLEPFIPRLHGVAFFQHATSFPEDFHFMRFTPPDTLEGLLTYVELTYRRNPANMLFVIIDKATGRFGGVAGLVNCDAEHRTADIAMGIAFRGYRGTSGSVLTASLLLRYCMNLPTDDVPGLGLRRVTWTSHASNPRSQGLARALGMRMEMEKRWSRAISPEKVSNGRMLRSGDPCDSQGVDDLFFVMCFDDWEAGGQNTVAFALATVRYEAKL
ncbi:hypothetical protein SCHPADRAFT_874454 [Schizopora paradoxa]|uniref:N-acetyltransferase domain-containing protein n=1 Tax=Schizopora paradoxa TaxID=27342 RepID=A0A0H2RUW2_9AGAM|nr:hypothetical protein SCHPADRAFT_874454 [Schizopora paradoxa]